MLNSAVRFFLFALLCVPQQLRANADACIAAPSKPCILEMATDFARDHFETKNSRSEISTGVQWTWQMLSIAIAQAKGEQGDYKATIDEMFAGLQQLQREYSETYMKTVYFRVFEAEFRNNLSDLPELSRYIATTFLELLPHLEGDLRHEDKFEATIAAALFLDLAGEHSRVEAMIQSAKTDQTIREVNSLKFQLIQQVAVLRFNRRDVQGALALDEFSSSGWVQQSLDMRLIRAGFYEEARDRILPKLSNSHDREIIERALQDLSFLLRSLARDRQLDEARDVIARSEELGFVDRIQEGIADVYIRTGDINRVASAIARIEQRENFGISRFGTFENWEAIAFAEAGLIAGDSTYLFKLLDRVNEDQSISKWDFRDWIDTPIAGYIQSGNAELDPIIEKVETLPLEFALEGLNSIALAQADSGDIEGAFATWQRLSAIDPLQEDSAWVNLKIEIAVYYAENGSLSEAVSMLNSMKNPQALSRIANLAD